MSDYLLGQEPVERALRKALEQRRMPHALLFVGPEGVGRERAARGLARALLCERGMDAASIPWGCGSCKNCRRVDSGGHPDVHVVMSEAEAVGRGAEPTSNKKRPSPDIVVDAVRELTLRLRMAPYEGGARVAIVVDAQRMNAHAQNALLKTLEEPGSHTVLVLLAPHERTLMPTIASRCARIRFAPLEQHHIETVLRTRGVADAEARAARARGSLSLAFNDAASEAPAAAALLDALLTGSALEKIDAAERMGKERSDVDAALAALSTELARAMRLPEHASPSGGLTWNTAATLLERVQHARRAIAQNASVQLCLEELLLSASPGAPK